VHPVPVRRAHPTAAHRYGRKQRPVLRLTFNAQLGERPHQGVKAVRTVPHGFLSVDREGAHLIFELLERPDVVNAALLIKR
jgi:hypothetical protein